MSEIQLGKGSKNYGVVDTAEFKGGIKREQLKTEEQKSIFDAADTDKNGILDANEMQQFTQKLQDAAGNEKLSKREAKKFLKNENLKDIDKKELFKFVNELSQGSENIAESKVVEQNGEKTILVTYKDGSQETINPDKTSQIMSTDENNAVTTKFFDENKKLTKEQVVQENGDSETTDIENDLPVTKTIVTNNGAKTAVIDYEDGVETKQSVTEGSVKSDYTYVDGKPVLTQKVEDLGNDVARTTDYTYNEDGTVTENITEPGKNTIRQSKDGNVLSEVITEGEKQTQRAFKDDGTTQELVTQGENKTATIYNTESGKRLEQFKIVDGKQYGIEYDGEGNTKGIVVQNGESISQIAKKFGVSADDLMAANQDKLKGKNNKYFSVGDEIKIPRELEANDTALQGRKSADEAKAEYARDEQIRQQRRAVARERDAAYKKLGLVNYKGAGEKVTGDYYKNNKKSRSVELTKIGNATHGRTIAKDKQGKIYVVAHNGVILKDSWVEISANRDTVKVGNNWVAVDGARGDGHARKNVIDANGNMYVMSHDNKILKNSYVQKSDRADNIRVDSKTAQTETMNMLSEQLDSAQAAFDQQMKEDGWAGDVADAVSVLWGSNNRASKVREDLKAYKNTIEELKVAAKKGDNAFKAKFKEKFGINYNQNAVADYLMKPSAENYRKAFGTKQSIGERVAKYNASQQAGAAIVKTTAEIGGAVALTAATIATGGVAGIVAGTAVAAGSTVVADIVVETTDRMSSEQGLQDGELFDIAKDSATDGTIAGLTFGASKYAKGVYGAYKATRATSAAGKVANASVKAEQTAQKAILGLENKASNVTTKGLPAAAEKTLTQAGNKSLATVNKGLARTGTNYVETSLTRAGANGASTAETGLAKFEQQTAKSAGNAAAQSTGTSTAQNASALTKTEEAVIETITDVGVGAGAEYVQTGEITVEGTLANAAVGSIGIAGEKLGNKLKSSNLYNKVKDKFNGADSAGKNSGLPKGPDGSNSGSSNGAKIGYAADVPPEGNNGAKGTDYTSGTKAKAKDAGRAEGASGKGNTENTDRTSRQQSTEKPDENIKHGQKVNDNASHATTEQEFQSEIDKLRPQLDEAQLAADIKEQFADLLNGNATDKNKLKSLILKVHPDRGGSEELMQAVNALKDAKSPAEVTKALNNLNSMLNQKSANLSSLKYRMNALNDGLEKTRAAKAENVKSEPKIDTDNAASGETPKSRPLTSEDRMAMSEIGENIGRARTAADLDKAQKWLDKMPDCDQKTRLQKQLNEKYQKLNEASGGGNSEQTGSASSNKANNQMHDFSKATEGTKLPKDEPVFLKGSETLELVDYELDLTSPQVKSKLDAMKNGDVITVGREGDIKIDDKYAYVSRKHLTIEKTNNGYIVKDTSANGTSIGEKLPEIDVDELCRVPGNNGKPVPYKYIRTSREARAFMNDAIESGSYTKNLDSYIKTMNRMHEISAHGKSGNYYWYGEAGHGSIEVNPGQIRGEGQMQNRRIDSALEVEKIAKQYGDPYRVEVTSNVELLGIPEKYRPLDFEGGYHVYPDGKSLEKYYYKEMHRSAKEALKLIDSGASERQILEKLAEHYQYAANARPYGQINNSLFMNEVNTLLSKAGMKGMPQGILDIVSMHLQPNTFKKYFVDQYFATALN